MTLEWLITWHELSLQKTLHKLRQVNATVLDELPSYQTAAIVVALAEKKCILMYIAVLGIVLGKTICSLAFNQRTMPELSGSVTAISAITVVDESSGFAFFRVGLAIPPDDLAILNNVELVPGMPVEALLKTGDRSVLSFPV